MYPPFPPATPASGDNMSIKKLIREWRAWEKFNKQRQEEDKKKKEEKKPPGPQLKSWEVFVLMTALSPIIGPMVNALKDYVVQHLQ